MFSNISEEIKSLFAKIIIPAMVAISIKLTVQSKVEKISIFMVGCSFVTGIGTVYLCSDLIMSTFSAKYQFIAISIIAISGDKIGHYLVYKLNVESIMNGWFSAFMNKNKK